MEEGYLRKPGSALHSDHQRRAIPVEPVMAEVCETTTEFVDDAWLHDIVVHTIVVTGDSNAFQLDITATEGSIGL
jgi:hypothetical protein